ncbi:outer membrane beta-barrel protein [Lysobacter antibioticus]|uniref:outer membrane beta-barrel protein n=1 Tax=Lysobacter antibioticus TaxID=84531 RepID=UPI0004D008ED|nr:outer membrane beta-barrel protein [Lysobacter antibioticus]
MKKQLALALALAMASSAAAAADGLSYTHVEAGYSVQKIELVTVDEDLDIEDPKAAGGYIAGSVALNDAMHLFGGYRQGSDDIEISYAGSYLGEVDIDSTQYQIGLGYHHTLSDRVDWTGELSYLRTEIDVEDEEAVEGDDYRASLGLRGDLAANFEGWIKANYTDGDVYDGEFSGTIGALVKFNETWGIVGEAEFGDKNSQFNLGVRASF